MGLTAVASDGGLPTPDGSVTFYDNGTPLAAVPLALSGGQDKAAGSTAGLGVGVHVIARSYASTSGNFTLAAAPQTVSVLVLAANATVYTVSNTSGDPTVSGSLPWAIAEANAGNSAAVITFAAGDGQAFATPQTITIETTMVLTDTSLVAVEGPAAGVTVVGDYGQSRFAVLSVAQNAEALVQGLTIGTQEPGGGRRPASGRRAGRFSAGSQSRFGSQHFCGRQRQPGRPDRHGRHPRADQRHTGRWHAHQRRAA